MAEQFVRRVVWFQISDGRIEFPSIADAELTLRPEIFRLVEDLLAQDADFTTAVTMVIIVLLQERFMKCEALWLLMVDKAKAYIRSQGGYHGPRGNFSLMEGARISVRLIQNLSLETRDGSSVMCCLDRTYHG